MQNEQATKKCQIDGEVFKELMEGVKHCVSKNANSRPILQCIQIAVKEKAVVFSALDGVRAGRTEHEQDNADCFTCYIPPFPYKPLRGMLSDVVIEYDGKTACVEFETEGGALRHTFNQPYADFPNLEELYEKNRVHESEVAVNGRFVAAACKNLARLGDKNGTVIIEKTSDNTRAFIIRAKNHLIKNEQMILPVRLHSESN